LAFSTYTDVFILDTKKR